ncbi:MAG: hypothetical protein CVU89_08605 [Firmicutes bacterium HGW-Firmicutes-14]|nr:MAG: hypothetical protein CVU89_08605 [Firmicutes bacterium HGW-Firmicutes-14]
MILLQLRKISTPPVEQQFVILIIKRLYLTIQNSIYIDNFPAIKTIFAKTVCHKAGLHLWGSPF